MVPISVGAPCSVALAFASLSMAMVAVITGRMQLVRASTVLMNYSNLVKNTCFSL